MKQYVIITLLASSGLATCPGAPTVLLNNKDANMPIFYLQTGTLPGNTSIYVEVIAFGNGPVVRAGTTGENLSDYVFKVDENGFFDAGVGVVPGAVDGQVVDFRLVAGYVRPDGPLFAVTGASLRGESSVWVQKTGSWDPKSGLPATGPMLQVASSPIVGTAGVLPETNSLTLTMFGGAAFLTNSVLKAVKNKPAKPQTQVAKPPAK